MRAPRLQRCSGLHGCMQSHSSGAWAGGMDEKVKLRVWKAAMRAGTAVPKKQLESAPQSLLPLHLLVQALDLPRQTGHLPPQLLSCCGLQTGFTHSPTHSFTIRCTFQHCAGCVQASVGVQTDFSELTCSSRVHA